jgi:hypothetical protein
MLFIDDIYKFSFGKKVMEIVDKRMRPSYFDKLVFKCLAYLFGYQCAISVYPNCMSSFWGIFWSTRISLWEQSWGWRKIKILGKEILWAIRNKRGIFSPKPTWKIV